MFRLLLNWLSGGVLDRLLQSWENQRDNETRREEIRADVDKTRIGAQAVVLTGPGWWFPLLFLVPAGFWFAAVCVYSVLWCRACAYPQDWSIAALPPPLNEWMGGIVASLFIGKGIEGVVGRIRN